LKEKPLGNSKKPSANGYLIVIIGFCFASPMVSEPCRGSLGRELITFLNPCPEGINFSMISRLLFVLTSMRFAIDGGKIDPSELQESFQLDNVRATKRRGEVNMRRMAAATIPRNVVAACWSAGLVPFEGPDGWWYLKFSKEKAIKLGHCRNAPVLEEAIEDEGRRRVRLP
jgi:hypothetical protein